MTETQADLARSAAAPEPRDLVPFVAALATFTSAMLAAWWLVRVDFRVDPAIQQMLFWGGLALAVIVVKRSVPSSRLTPAQRARRERRRAGGLVGVLGAALLLGGYVAATLLDSWSQWGVLGIFVFTTIGIFFMVNTHFGMG